MKLQIFGRFLENNKISNFMKIRLVGAETFQVDVQVWGI